MLNQYQAVRDGMGWWDRSDVGKIAISGEDRFSWLQGMISNDTKWLAANRYDFFRACVLDATGHVLTDLSLVRFNDVSNSTMIAEAIGLAGQEFLLADLPRQNLEKILHLFDRYLIMEDVELKDVSDTVGCFTFQGSKAYDAWDIGTDNQPLEQAMKLSKSIPADYNDSRGFIGFNAYFPIERAAEIRALIAQAGIVEVGLEAQEVLRVEAGIPKYGLDVDETTLAPEAYGKSHLSTTKGCYVGQEIVARIEARGHTNRALTGLVFAEDDIPSTSDKIYSLPDGDNERRETGRITSVVAASPAMNGRPIALGYVRHEHRAPGLELRVESERGSLRAEVVELPFYRSLSRQLLSEQIL